MTDQQVEFSSLFSPAQILCAVHEMSLDVAVHQLIALIGAADSSVDVEAVYRLVLARDQCGVMLVEPRVAVIHARMEGLRRLRMALIVSRDGIACSADRKEFECAGGESGPVSLLVLMLAPADDPAGYLRAVIALRAVCRRENFVERLSVLEDPELVWECFEETGERLPEYVAAGDIMRTEFPRLRDTDTLCAAIDLLCREGVSELPVVDADGDLVGLVSEDELIRACLPEYITWMQDLSPILNFQPFAEVLRRETHVPVLEIMVFAERYATVDEATPAIQVAKVMMRRDVRQVLVVHGKKLSGTMLGNPVGILIGSRAGLTFEDFMVWAFPVMLRSLVATVALLMVWYRKEIRLLSERMEQRRGHALPLGPIVAVPFLRGLLLIGGTIGLVALHHRIEVLLGLETNTVLHMAPLVSAGIVMIWRRERARHYIEHDVEWWTLIFFLMLFGVAGTLEYTQVTVEVASSLKGLLGDQTDILVPAVMTISALGSAFVDNVIFVAAFIPVVQELIGEAPGTHPLWWSLLFGACFGGNITMIGSTANIVALGMLEKRYRTHINFLEWFRVGLAAGFVACLVAWLALLVTGPLMVPGAG